MPDPGAPDDAILSAAAAPAALQLAPPQVLAAGAPLLRQLPAAAGRAQTRYAFATALPEPESLLMERGMVSSEGMWDWAPRWMEDGTVASEG